MRTTRQLASLLWLCLQLTTVGTILANSNPSASAASAEAAISTVTDLWWTGDGVGNAWTTAENWSSTDPAITTTVAVSPPSTATNVHFTDASFTSGTSNPVVGGGTINCRDLNVTGLNGATLSISNISINVYGSVSFLDVTDGFVFKGNLDFKSSSSGNTIDLGDQVTDGRMRFDGVGGVWTFVEGVTEARAFELVNGYIDFGNHDYHFSGFYSSGTNTRAIDYGTSKFTLEWHVGAVHSVTGEMAYRLGTPSFTFLNSGNFTDNSSSGEVLNIQKVEKLSSTRLSLSLVSGQSTLDSLVLQQAGFYLVQNATVDYVEVGGEETTTLNNKTLTVEEFVTNLDCGYHDIEGGTIDFVAVPVAMPHVQLRSVTGLVGGVAPSTPIAANPGLDNSNNNGFTFTPGTGREMYWIGKTGEWHTVTNWSYSSGGTPLAANDCPPSILDNVYFDANSFDADGQVMTISNFTASCNNMIWNGLDQIEIDWAGSELLKLGGDLTLDANMKEILTFSGTIELIDQVDGVLDFKSGVDHRQLINCGAASQPGSTYRQISSRVTFRTLSMASNITASYDLGGNQDTLHLETLTSTGTLDMEDAILVITGNNRAVWRVAHPILYDANSHIYVTNDVRTSFDESAATFPSITQTSPTGGVYIRLRDMTVDGTLIVNGKLQSERSITTVANLVLAEAQTHILEGGFTYTMDSLICVASSCNKGATITTDNALQAKLDLPKSHADIQFASVANIDYIGDASPLELAGLFNIDAANNTNVDFGGSSAKTFYWRASGVDGNYTGDWGSPHNWTLNPVNTAGQTDPLGCTPSAIDTVIFDALSGNGSAATVTISDGQLVNSVIWKEGETPANMTWEVTSAGTLTLTGELTLSSNMATLFDESATFSLNGLDTTRITTAGVDLNGLFILENGVKLLEDEVFGSADIDLRSGTFDANEFDMTLGNFRSDIVGTRVIDVTNSQITLTESQRITASTHDQFYAWHLHNTAGLTYHGVGTNFHITAAGNAAFKGAGYTYNGVVFENLCYVVDDNTFADSLVFKGAATLYGNNTINKLSLKADAVNVTYTFPAGGTTYFMEGATFDKNGDLNQYVNLTSSTTGVLHSFEKTTGGAMYICNINVTDIDATTVPFKTNNASTYNGLAGTAAVPPVGSSWDFNVSAAAPDISMDVATEVHYNRGDSVEVAWTITNNDSGPFQVDYTIDAGTYTVDKLADGMVNRDTILVGPTASTDVVISNIRYFDCPGVYNPGNVVVSTTPLRVPPVTNGLAADGGTEDYELRNLNSYVYIMDGGDRLNLLGHTSRNTQVAINDFTGAGDSEALGVITATTSIDASEMNANDHLYLKRHYSLSTAGTNGAAKVKLFFSEAELQSLKTLAKFTGTDLDFLAMLEVTRNTMGETPATETGTMQPMMTSGLASEINATTYFVEVSASSFEGEYFIGTPESCTINDLAALGTSTVVDQTCDRGNWKYYYSGANPSKALFAIEHNPVGGNTTTFTANVTLSVTADPTIADGSFDVTDLVANEGNFVMGRYWNVNITSGSLDGPVNVRFFYDPVEMAATQAEAQAFAATDPSLNVSAPIWFKTVGVDFDPSQITATTINNQNLVIFESPATGIEDGVNYVQLDGITSFSGGGMASRVSTDAAPALPVELISFSAKSEGCNTALDWTTATERDFSHYAVQRSTDGRTFSTIGKVNASDAGAYTYTDRAPARQSYYRLQLVDLDGTESYSDVVAVQSDCNAVAQEMVIAPNPIAQGESLTVRFAAESEAAILTVLDMLGRPVYETQVFGGTGTSSFAVDTRDLAAGNYVLRLENGANVQTKKFTVR